MAHVFFSHFFGAQLVARGSPFNNRSWAPLQTRCQIAYVLVSSKRKPQAGWVIVPVWSDSLLLGRSSLLRGYPFLSGLVCGEGTLPPTIMEVDRKVPQKEHSVSKPSHQLFRDGWREGTIHKKPSRR